MNKVRHSDTCFILCEKWDTQSFAQCSHYYACSSLQEEDIQIVACERTHSAYWSDKKHDRHILPWWSPHTEDNHENVEIDQWAFTTTKYIHFNNALT